MEFVHPSSIRDDVFRKTKLATMMHHLNKGANIEQSNEDLKIKLIKELKEKISQGRYSINYDDFITLAKKVSEAKTFKELKVKFNWSRIDPYLPRQQFHHGLHEGILMTVSVYLAILPDEMGNINPLIAMIDKYW